MTLHTAVIPISTAIYCHILCAMQEGSPSQWNLTEHTKRSPPTHTQAIWVWLYFYSGYIPKPLREAHLLIECLLFIFVIAAQVDTIMARVTRRDDMVVDPRQEVGATPK